MKKIKCFLKNTVTALFLFMFLTNVNAERKIRYSPLLVTDFVCSITNIHQTANNKLEFDVLLLDTDPTQAFEFAGGQIGIWFNSLIYSGGTLTVTYSNTNSTLNTSQQFSSVPNTATQVNNQTLLKLAGRTPPGSGNGTIISQVSPGTLVTHFIFTSSVAFTTGTTPNFSFATSTYPLTIAEYINNTNTALTIVPGTNAIVDGNPVLNAAPTAYAVTGSGSFCQDGLGLAVGLSNSDIGVNYQLYSAETAVGSPVAGTGSAISFGNQTAGTYTVTATNTTTLITGSMTGSAVITANPPVTPDVSIEASSNPAATGTSVTFTPTQVNGGLNPAYEWFVNNVSVGTGETYSYVPTDGDQIYTKMTSNDTSPCLTGNPATSNTITMSVSPGTGFSNEKALRINTYSTNKAIYIDCPTKIQQLSVYNMLGSVVAMEENVSGLRKINLNNFPNECYIVKVVTDNNVTTQKILLK